MNKGYWCIKISDESVKDLKAIIPGCKLLRQEFDKTVLGIDEIYSPIPEGNIVFSTLTNDDDFINGYPVFIDINSYTTKDDIIQLKISLPEYVLVDKEIMMEYISISIQFDNSIDIVELNKVLNKIKFLRSLSGSLVFYKVDNI